MHIATFHRSGGTPNGKVNQLIYHLHVKHKAEKAGTN
jgi:hypothetical protein